MRYCSHGRDVDEIGCRTVEWRPRHGPAREYDPGRPPPVRAASSSACERSLSIIARISATQGGSAGAGLQRFDQQRLGVTDGIGTGAGQCDLTQCASELPHGIDLGIEFGQSTAGTGLHQ